eukprot:4472228-Amphidinium_carterae.1
MSSTCLLSTPTSCHSLAYFELGAPSSLQLLALHHCPPGAIEISQQRGAALGCFSSSSYGMAVKVEHCFCARVVS